LHLHDLFLLCIPWLIRHADDLWGELADHIHQIELGSDDFVDGFVRLRRLVDAAAKQGDTAFFQVIIPFALADGIDGDSAAHSAARTM
jgi:hypothetical protein